MTQTALAPVEEMEFLAEWTPEALKQAIEREKVTQFGNFVLPRCDAGIASLLQFAEFAR